MPDFVVVVVLHCIVEAPCVVKLCDRFRVAVKATAAFNPRDWCLITHRLNLICAKIWSMFLCLLQNTAHVHLGLKSKRSSQAMTQG